MLMVMVIYICTVLINVSKLKKLFCVTGKLLYFSIGIKINMVNCFLYTFV